jgi:hypothetical protein
MRHFGKRVNQSGDTPAHFSGTLETDFKRRQPGERVKYRMNGNSAKFYDKAYSEIGSVLRGAETTINTVGDFLLAQSRQRMGESNGRTINQLFWDQREDLVGAGRFERPTPCAQGSFRPPSKTPCFQALRFQ